MLQTEQDSLAPFVGAVFAVLVSFLSLSFPLLTLHAWIGVVAASVAVAIATACLWLRGDSTLNSLASGLALLTALGALIICAILASAGPEATRASLFHYFRQ